jgi:hypothetical protein
MRNFQGKNRNNWAFISPHWKNHGRAYFRKIKLNLERKSE